MCGADCWQVSESETENIIALDPFQNFRGHPNEFSWLAKTPSWILARTELLALAGLHSLVFDPDFFFLAAFDRLPPLLYCRRSRNSLWNFCDRLIQDYLSSQTLQIRPQWSVLSVTSAFWSKGPRLFRTASFWRLSITCRNKGWTSDASYFTVTLSACVVKRICCLD